MTIAKDSVVSIHYTLTDDQGQQIDSSVGAEPLVYLQGHQNIIPGLEKELEGKTKGDKLTVKVTPEEGYGTRDEALIQALPKEQFEATETIEPGMQFQAQAPTGQTVILTVIEVNDDAVIVDGNHALAGVTLNFDVEIVEIRTATEDELAQGHVH